MNNEADAGFIYRKTNVAPVSVRTVKITVILPISKEI
jgi:hypothetical protein